MCICEVFLLQLLERLIVLLARLLSGRMEQFVVAELGRGVGNLLGLYYTLVLHLLVLLLFISCGRHLNFGFRPLLSVLLGRTRFIRG